MNRYKNQGWRNEAARHGLAAKGIKTKQLNVHGRRLPLEIQQHPKDHVYLTTPEEIQDSLNQLPQESTGGIRKVSMRPPSSVAASGQSGAWGQYAKTDRRINVFSQPYLVKKGKVIIQDTHGESTDPAVIRKKINGYVIPHEVGHHQALTVRKKTKDDLATAEARADAFVAGHDVEDSSAVKKYRQAYT